MTRSKGRRGMHPAFAITMFAVSAGIAVKAVFGSLSSAPVAGDPAVDAMSTADETAAGEVADGDEGRAAAGRDLLAAFGSFERGGVVNQAFGVFAEASVPAAPAGEVWGSGPGAAVPAGNWVGDEPPRLRLGVVLLSGQSRRAVLDGRVVGVGDAVGPVRVLMIESGQVVVAWQARRLTYRLDSDVPLEFRAEAARRQANNGDAAGAASAKDQAKKEEGK